MFTRNQNGAKGEEHDEEERSVGEVIFYLISNAPEIQELDFFEVLLLFHVLLCHLLVMLFSVQGFLGSSPLERCRVKVGRSHCHHDVGSSVAFGSNKSEDKAWRSIIWSFGNLQLIKDRP